jgi:hypothetical protein
LQAENEKKEITNGKAHGIEMYIKHYTLREKKK